MTPRPLVVANWKMHKMLAETDAFARELLPLVAGETRVDVAIAPPFPALPRT